MHRLRRQSRPSPGVNPGIALDRLTGASLQGSTPDGSGTARLRLDHGERQRRHGALHLLVVRSGRNLHLRGRDLATATCSLSVLRLRGAPAVEYVYTCTVTDYYGQRPPPTVTVTFGCYAALASARPQQRLGLGDRSRHGDDGHLDGRRGRRHRELHLLLGLRLGDVVHPQPRRPAARPLSKYYSGAAARAGPTAARCPTGRAPPSQRPSRPPSRSPRRRPTRPRSTRPTRRPLAPCRTAARRATPDGECGLRPYVPSQQRGHRPAPPVRVLDGHRRHHGLAQRSTVKLHFTWTLDSVTTPASRRRMRASTTLATTPACRRDLDHEHGGRLRDLLADPGATGEHGALHSRSSPRTTGAQRPPADGLRLDRSQRRRSDRSRAKGAASNLERRRRNERSGGRLSAGSFSTAAGSWGRGSPSASASWWSRAPSSSTS